MKLIDGDIYNTVLTETSHMTLMAGRVGDGTGDFISSDLYFKTREILTNAVNKITYIQLKPI